MKLFIDTNIFLDLILKREHFHDALLIFNAIEKKIFSALILDITILNIEYVAKKQVSDIRSFIALVAQNFVLCGVTNEMVARALKIDNSDFEDTIQYLSAKDTHCDMIITNDKYFYRADIPVSSSSDFVAKYL